MRTELISPLAVFCGISWLVMSCGGNAITADSERSDSSSGGGGGAGNTAGAVMSADGNTANPDVPSTSVAPKVHRAERQACDEQRPIYNAGQDLGFTPSPTSSCVADSECTAGVRGRCQTFRGELRCTYDSCQQDNECTLGGPCGCEQSFWSEANSCLAGNCQIDSDCGDEGYCSPTLNDCGLYSGAFSGYWCHTPEDQCLNDSDCNNGAENGPGYCQYINAAGRWQCSYGGCDG